MSVTLIEEDQLGKAVPSKSMDLSEDDFKRIDRVIIAATAQAFDKTWLKRHVTVINDEDITSIIVFSNSRKPSRKSSKLNGAEPNLFPALASPPSFPSVHNDIKSSNISLKRSFKEERSAGSSISQNHVSEIPLPWDLPPPPPPPPPGPPLEHTSTISPPKEKRRRVEPERNVNGHHGGYTFGPSSGVLKTGASEATQLLNDISAIPLPPEQPGTPQKRQGPLKRDHDRSFMKESPIIPFVRTPGSREGFLKQMSVTTVTSTPQSSHYSSSTPSTEKKWIAELPHDLDVSMRDPEKSEKRRVRMERKDGRRLEKAALKGNPDAIDKVDWKKLSMAERLKKRKERFFESEETAKADRREKRRRIFAVDGHDESEGEKFTLFFTKKFPFSNHYPCKITIDGQIFNCTEQYYMWQKAVTFGDEDIAERILKSDDPKEQKKLSGEIKNFNTSIWDGISQMVMEHANMEKYKQNAHLRRALFSTAGTTLVECNPSDRKWGIGLSMKDPRALSRAQWQGQNWLGQILTKIRDILANDDEFQKDLKRSQTNAKNCVRN